jgi:hypothetical protein
MSGIKDDEVVQTLSADRADEPLGVWILPGAAGRREDFLDLQRSHTRPNVAAINAVPIPQQIARGVMLGEGLDNLLRRPGCRGVVRYVEVQHLPTTMFHYDEHEQHLQGDSRHGEEVNRNHLTEVIAQERLPGLAGRLRQSPEDSRDSAFGITMPSIVNSQ